MAGGGDNISVRLEFHSCPSEESKSMAPLLMRFSKVTKVKEAEKLPWVAELYDGHCKQPLSFYSLKVLRSGAFREEQICISSYAV